jgi:hypothetical protein
VSVSQRVTLLPQQIHFHIVSPSPAPFIEFKVKVPDHACKNESHLRICQTILVSISPIRRIYIGHLLPADAIPRAQAEWLECSLVVREEPRAIKPSLWDERIRISLIRCLTVGAICCNVNSSLHSSATLTIRGATVLTPPSTQWPPICSLFPGATLGGAVCCWWMYSHRLI